MEKILIGINRLFIVIDALIRGFFYKNRKKRNCNTDKQIVIVFQQVFGDSVVIQNSIHEYLKLFPLSDGYKIKFLVKPAVLKFMREVLDIPNQIEYEELDFRLFLENYKYYKRVVKTYTNNVSMLIVPGTSLSAEIFATANNANRKVGLVRCSDVKHPFLYAVFYRLAYTEQVKPNKDEMMLQRHRALLYYLGDMEYKARLPKAISHKALSPEKKYVVMCPGASKMEKCWPIERFAHIADYIIEKYDTDVYLCGGIDEKHFAVELLNLAKHKDRIVETVGSTTFTEWSAIVEGAELVIGNDSATLHLAVAHRRKAICISGVYDKYQFFPYKVDEIMDGDILPVTMIKDMPCEYCRTVGYVAGYGNSECADRIKGNKCALCVDLINVKDVMNQIDALMFSI